MFKKATKAQAKARIGITGPSGSGKTYTSLLIASSLAHGKRVAVIDSERGSASKYASEFDFDVCDLESFAPRAYVQAIHAAEKAGYGVIVVDSLSHAWMGKDGALAMVDAAAARSKGSSFAAWRDVTPEHNALVEAMVQSTAHLVATLRSKTEYVLEKDERTGKTVPKKIGMAPVQRDGLEYEFDLFFEMDQEHRLIVTKSRSKELADKVMLKPGQELGESIARWLGDGSPRAFDVIMTTLASAEIAENALDASDLQASVKNLLDAAWAGMNQHERSEIKAASQRVRQKFGSVPPPAMAGATGEGE